MKGLLKRKSIQKAASPSREIVNEKAETKKPLQTKEKGCSNESELGSFIKKKQKETPFVKTGTGTINWIIFEEELPPVHQIEKVLVYEEKKGQVSVIEACTVRLLYEIYLLNKGNETYFPFSHWAYLNVPTGFATVHPVLINPKTYHTTSTETF